MKKICLWSFSLLLVATLFGCGGGGGGGGGGLTTNIFTDWPSVDPPENVGLSGISQDIEYELDPDNPPFTITTNPVSAATATIRYRANGTIERIDVDTPYINLTWNEAAGDIISNSGPMIFAGDPNVLRFGVFFNPRDMPPADAWEYQTFGAWADARPVAAGAVGALSFGTPTPGDDLIPLVNTAEFTGYSAGIYTTSDGTTAFATESLVTVDVNFLDRELAFRTTGTTLFNIQDGKEWVDSQVGPEPTLDITSVGPLRYDPGVNLFRGDVSAPGLTVLSGESRGQFYGPAAEELGGVFSLTGSDGLEHYSGAYGARDSSLP